MLISELIAEMEKLKAEHGDLEFAMLTSEEGEADDFLFCYVPKVEVFERLNDYGVGETKVAVVAWPNCVPCEE